MHLKRYKDIQQKIRFVRLEHYIRRQYRHSCAQKANNTQNTAGILYDRLGPSVILQPAFNYTHTSLLPRPSSRTVRVINMYTTMRFDTAEDRTVMYQRLLNERPFVNQRRPRVLCFLFPATQDGQRSNSLIKTPDNATGSKDQKSHLSSEKQNYELLLFSFFSPPLEFCRKTRAVTKIARRIDTFHLFAPASGVRASAVSAEICPARQHRDPSHETALLQVLWMSCGTFYTSSDPYRHGRALFNQS